MFRWTAMGLVVLGASSYGMLSPLTKFAMGGGWSGVQISVMQITMGAIMMWLLIPLNRRVWTNPFRGPWIKLSLIGIIGIALTTVIFNMALTELDASLAVILLFQFTWISVVIEAIWLRRMPGKLQLCAIGVILLGTLLAINIFAVGLQRFSLMGVGLGLAAGCGYSVFLVCIGQVRTSMHSLMKSAVMLTAALPVTCLFYPPWRLLQPDIFPLLLWGVLLGFLGQVVPTICFNIGIPRIGGSLAAALGSIELPVALLGAWMILRETILWVQWSGMLVILLGILIAQRNSSA